MGGRRKASKGDTLVAFILMHVLSGVFTVIFILIASGAAIALLPVNPLAAIGVLVCAGILGMVVGSYLAFHFIYNRAKTKGGILR